MKDLKNSITGRLSLAAATRTTTATGTAVDRKGFDSLTWFVRVGDWTNGAHTVSFEHSDNGTDYSAVLATDLIGDAPVITDNDDSPATPTYENTAILVGYRGDKRYCRPVVTVTGSPATGANIGIDAVLGHPHLWPAE